MLSSKLYLEQRKYENMLTRVGDATIVADRVKQKVAVSSDRVLEAELTQGRSRLFFTQF